MSEQNLKNLISECESFIPMLEKTNVEITSSTVGWQLDHTLRVIVQIIYVLKRSKPEEYKWKFNFFRIIVLRIRKGIPRGRAKAPKNVTATEPITIDSLQRLASKANELILELDMLDKNNFFAHPYFGDLNLAPTKKFLEIHTTHHLKIVRDILK